MSAHLARRLAALALICPLAACEPQPDDGTTPTSPPPPGSPCATASCPDDASCRVVDGAAYCDCNAGFIGSPGYSALWCAPATTAGGTCREVEATQDFACDCNEGYFPLPDNSECREFAPSCDALTCDPNAYCQMLSAGYVCTCKAGFEGDGKTCARIGDLTCSPRCGANATCHEEDNAGVCRCDAGYFGDGVTGCYPIETTSGTCDIEGGAVVCSCEPGYAHTPPEVACADIDECDLPDQGGCEAWCTNTEGGATCTSTVNDASSPYWKYSCDPTFSHNAGQTDLIVDCRCSQNKLSGGDLGLCQRPSTAAELGFTYGSGPRMHDIARNLPRVLAGVMDQATRKIYLGIGYTSPADSYHGAIMEIDADTGARRIVAGLWPDEFGGTVYGSGMAPYLPEVQNLAFGPDGALYAWVRTVINNAQIVKVDVATGELTVLWREHVVLQPELYNDPAHAQCSNGLTAANGARTWVQVNERGFAVDDNGDFLLSAMASAASSFISPTGIIKIKHDGSECTWMRRDGAGPDNGFSGQPIGSGAHPQPGIAFRALYRHQGKIWAIDNFTKVYEIDPANGWRARNFASDIAEDWMAWDASRQVMWMAGAGGGANNIVAYHPSDTPSERWSAPITCDNAAREGFECVEGPLQTCCLNHGPMMYDELRGHVIVQHDIHGTVRIEIETGNAYTFSL